jgi:hypothetical protein
MVAPVHRAHTTPVAALHIASMVSIVHAVLSEQSRASTP